MAPYHHALGPVLLCMDGKQALTLRAKRDCTAKRKAVVKDGMAKAEGNGRVKTLSAGLPALVQTPHLIDAEALKPKQRDLKALNQATETPEQELEERCPTGSKPVAYLKNCRERRARARGKG